MATVAELEEELEKASASYDSEADGSMRWMSFVVCDIAESLLHIAIVLAEIRDRLPPRQVSIVPSSLGDSW